MNAGKFVQSICPNSTSVPSRRPAGVRVVLARARGMRAVARGLLATQRVGEVAWGRVLLILAALGECWQICPEHLPQQH